MSALLEIAGLESGYGTSQVLFGIDLRIDEGEIVTLLGRNGMGKTTTIRSFLGLTPRWKGTVRFRREDIGGRPAYHIAKLGMALVPEGRQIFPNLNVEENLVAFANHRGRGNERWTAERVYALFPRLQERKKNFGNQLSGGEQQMLAIGRALMTNPHLLVLDEATEGLAPLIREEIWQCLKMLSEQGQTILLIDKYVQRLIKIAHRHTIIERGRVVWTGSSKDLDANHGVWHRYLGV
ncbi:MAG: ABC transporter ATP-binding protein [Burkholderiales bacterium]